LFDAEQVGLRRQIAGCIYEPGVISITSNQVFHPGDAFLRLPSGRRCRRSRLCDRLADVTYFVGHETVTARADGKGLPQWQEALFAAMERNSAHVTDYFRLPADQVVEIGRQIAI
jgi:K+ potassium transporter C-terminal domain